MPDILVLQNDDIEGIGHLGRLLRDDGFTLDVVHASRQKIPEGSYSAGVILGSPASANDDRPYLRREMDTIRELVRRDVPLLGVCLGSQLIARSFGAAVYRGGSEEIGFYSDVRISKGGSRLFSGFDDPFTVFHWHGDTFDLPAGGVRLASSGAYENQAVQVGSAVGLQFHLEVDLDMIRPWLGRLGGSRSAARSDIAGSAARKIPLIHRNMEMFYDNFKSAFGM